MGKRKIKKTQQSDNIKKNGNDNQENQQVKGNYQTPSKKNNNYEKNKDERVNCTQTTNHHQSDNSQTYKQYHPQDNEKVNEKSEQKTKQQNKQEQVKVPQNKLQEHPQLQQEEASKEKNNANRRTNEQKVQDNNLIQQQTNDNKNNLNQPHHKTLLHTQKQLSQQVQANQHSGKVLKKNEQNSLLLQLDHNKRHQMEQFVVEGGFESGLDEDEDEADYEEEYGDEHLQLSFQQFQSNLNAQTAATNTNNNHNYPYEQSEVIQFTDNQTHTTNSNLFTEQNQTYLRNLNNIKNRQFAKDIQQLSMEAFIQRDEQIQSDMKFCLYCIYNNHDISQYFKQLLRIQRKLKECSFQLSPDVLSTLFEDNIKEFMHGIRDKLIEEMKNLHMIKQKPPTRRYSFDDYFLIDKTFSRSYSLHGYNNEILNHCMKYMLDSKYESIRNDLRHRIWSEMRINNEIIVSFYQQPDAYQKIFDLLIKFYTRVRDSILGIEEMWFFFMESVFNQELKGNMIFEQFHKQIFKKDILKDRYIQSFLKEINETQIDLDNRRQQNQHNQLDPIIENISQILFELDEDLNFQFPEEGFITGGGGIDSSSQQDLQQQIQQQNNQINQNQYEDPQQDEEIKDDLIGDASESDLIITYQQLQEKQKAQYGGQTLAQSVEQYSAQSSNYLNIYQSIQEGKRYQDLMDNLPNLDTDTLCYIIENNLTRKEYENILLQSQQKASQKLQASKQESMNDDIIISPSKNLNFLNQYFQNAASATAATDEIYNDNCNNSLSNEDEDEDIKAEKQLEKKKRKNLKKKRKRKEKKILAQHQIQLEEMLRLKLLEEQQKRGFNNEQIRTQLRKKLIDHLGIDQSDIDQYLSNFSIVKQDGPKKSHSDCSQNDLQTKKTQCDENSDHDHTLEQELEFEKDLESFRERLEKTNQTHNFRQRQKLLPNISEGWVHQLRERLKHYYQCQSPKSNGANKEQVDYGNHSEGLWAKCYQRSA